MQDYFEAPESIEARAIMRLVSLGSTTTLDDARELIGIPERERGAGAEPLCLICGQGGRSHRSRDRFPPSSLDGV